MDTNYGITSRSNVAGVSHKSRRPRALRGMESGGATNYGSCLRDHVSSRSRLRVREMGEEESCRHPQKTPGPFLQSIPDPSTLRRFSSCRYCILRTAVNNWLLPHADRHDLLRLVGTRRSSWSDARIHTLR
ncbi:hypothetical protein PMAYCL1PPCAC_03204 [Pristionchus mayeri]|uniref:Uncharacterized protein n=1 Tax=Pristionchus mayeri TaxID=1317129 RepID=A0AAN4Z473_9BILA|nr:hypothetical protein PMAYCL1PPCAC_03204 [Pristionchus mayeri]